MNIPKICPFCNGHLFLDHNACCLTCSSPYHKIDLRNKCNSDMEYNIKLWYRQRREYFGWEDPREREWKENIKQQRINRQMSKLKNRLDAWYRLHKHKRIISKKFEMSSIPCEICGKDTGYPRALEINFLFYPQQKDTFALLYVCYEHQRYIQDLIKNREVIELLRNCLKYIDKERYKRLNKK